MLKRQRASSPFPQSPSVAQDITSEGIIDIRDLKRRRVAPPSLDGQTRGWNAHPSNSSSGVEDYEEEESIEDERHGRGEAKLAQPGNAEYAEVNSVLKEIHILHKHRQMFVPPVPLLPNILQADSPHYQPNKDRLSYYPEHQTLAEESARVYEHYEGANRSLASAFLSRRQQSAGQP